MLFFGAITVLDTDQIPVGVRVYGGTDCSNQVLTHWATQDWVLILLPHRKSTLRTSGTREGL